MDSKAISRIQSIILVVLIAVAIVAGSATYYFWSQTGTSSETIKIGVLSDLDGLGRFGWQAVLLAAEQVNEEGGILGRQVEVIGEDTDTGSGVDPTKIMSALNRLLTIHEVDFIVGDSFQVGIDTISQYKTICISIVVNNFEELVLEDYDKYKYFFSVCPNTTSIAQGTVAALQTLSENTDFTKVAYLFAEGEQPTEIMNIFDAALPELYGYEIVYRGSYPRNVIDFSSYFAQAEAAGAEILIPWVGGFEGAPFVKEYNDRQSPMLIYSGLLGAASVPDALERTGGKCE